MALGSQQYNCSQLNRIIPSESTYSISYFYVICLSETYLDSNIAPDDDNLEVAGCNLVHSDHPPNVKRGGVYIYCKNYLLLKVVNILLK